MKGLISRFDNSEISSQVVDICPQTLSRLPAPRRIDTDDIVCVHWNGQSEICQAQVVVNPKPSMEKEHCQPMDCMDNTIPAATVHTHFSDVSELCQTLVLANPQPSMGGQPMEVDAHRQDVNAVKSQDGAEECGELCQAHLQMNEHTHPPSDNMDKDKEPPVKPKLRSAKPRVKKVRKWCRLKSGLFGWKTATVQEGLPKPLCKVEDHIHILKNYSDSASATFFKKNFENQQQLPSKSGSTKSGCTEF